MELCCKITNVNSNTIKKVILRKFFQILFISEDFKQIDIYSAIIAGGGNSDNISELSSDFALRFEFSAENSKQISSQNITKSFFSQLACVKGIWGKDSEIINKQDIFVQHLSEVFKSEIDNGKFQIKESETSLSSQHTVVYISDPKKTAERTYLTALAKAGEVILDNEKFTISANVSKDNPFHHGIELINWIKTTMAFDTPINENEFVEYRIELEPGDGRYFLPDFTFYISPPPNYLVESDTAIVKRSFIDGQDKSESNMIQSVGRADQLYYSQWKDDHHIESRRMSRLIPKSMLSEINKPSPYKSLSIRFTVNNPSKQPIIFFILGVLLSSALAFGSDFTRMSCIKEYFPMNHWIQPDVVWVIVSIMSFLTIFISTTRLKETSRPKDWYMKCLKTFVTWGFSLWVIVLFIFLRIDPIPFPDMKQIYLGVNTLIFSTVFLANSLFLILFFVSKKIAANYTFNSVFVGFRK